MLPVEVAFVSYDPRAQTAIVFLRERLTEDESPIAPNGSEDKEAGDADAGTDRRLLPICIGLPEAHAIYTQIEGKEPARPMTHDLLANVITSFGGTVRAVVVHTLENVVFHGRIEIDTGSGHMELDSRPSDAIALALRVESPIFVEEAVMEESAVSESDIRSIGDPDDSLKDFLEIADEDSYVKV
jgi:hypothetical protein